MLRYIKGTLAYGLRFSVNGEEDDLYQVSQMPTGQGIQIIYVLLLGMFSKWLIPQSVGAARNKPQLLNALQRQNTKS